MPWGKKEPTPEEAAAGLDRLAKATEKAIEKGEKLAPRHFDEIVNEPWSWEANDVIDQIAKDAASYDAVTRYVPMATGEADVAHRERTGRRHPTLWEGGDPEGAGTAYPINNPDAQVIRGRLGPDVTVGQEQAQARLTYQRQQQKIVEDQRGHDRRIRDEAQEIHAKVQRDAQAMARRHAQRESTTDARHHGGFWSGLFSAFSGGSNWVDAEAERMQQRHDERSGPPSGRWINGTWYDDD